MHACVRQRRRHVRGRGRERVYVHVCVRARGFLCVRVCVRGLRQDIGCNSSGTWSTLRVPPWVPREHLEAQACVAVRLGLGPLHQLPNEYPVSSS
jgi:hypothetical protein